MGGKSRHETWQHRNRTCMYDLILSNKSKKRRLSAPSLGECTKTNVHNDKRGTNRHASVLSFTPLLRYKKTFYRYV